MNPSVNEKTKGPCDPGQNRHPSQGITQRADSTWGGVGVEAVRAPDIISSVISFPPWFGSRIRIWGKKAMG